MICNCIFIESKFVHSLRHDECEVSDCSGHGHCQEGRCVCMKGFNGEFCQKGMSLCSLMLLLLLMLLMLLLLVLLSHCYLLSLLLLLSFAVIALKVFHKWCKAGSQKFISQLFKIWIIGIWRHYMTNPFEFKRS